MRTKNFVVLLVCIICTSVYLCLFGSQRPTIENIVSQTHKQLNNLKSFKENLIDIEEKTLEVDPKYLNLVGLQKDTPVKYYPSSAWTNSSLPVIVTSVTYDEEFDAIGFVRNAHHFAPNHTVMVYNLGLGQAELENVLRHCNHSRCVVIMFDLRQFPSHVDDNKLHAYRPLIIADAVIRAGAVIYMDSDQRLTSGRLSSLLALAEKGGGVVSWPTRHATSTLTHPKMFDFFHTTPDNFLFVPMVLSSRLVVLNTKLVQDKFLVPWVQCALTAECIAPVGSQSSGCRFDKKPQYRYSGCHRYDNSALNLALALAFNFDDSKYSYSGKESFFRIAKSSSETTANLTDVLDN
ncbi:uncharacterized protein LOC132200955 [Neocloeon triangulifer]|uniref:uncharacterized protein LOC132200955 n=1 Tax=Neocloeon triangulifer TaxID=2078957 RepID=UPI00286ECC8A|nr:uncharacterized protein LOC132200955 [Neocloeon triangulifer]